MKSYPLGEALKAQQALRAAAGLEPEQFPVQAFIGMISDEIEVLRNKGLSDPDIATLVATHSSIQITPDEIAQFYATPEERQQHGHA